MTERYKNGKIYTIRYRNDSTLIYVGSTCLPLYKRWHAHKKRCFRAGDEGYDCLLYQKIRETNDIENWYIELYENYPTDSKELLLKFEGEVIRKLSTLNKRIEGRTKQEYQQDNKEKICERKQKYKESHRDEIKTKSKEYYDNNKIIIIEKRKEYYENNKNIIAERCKEKIICECGCEIRKDNLKRHMKSTKHLEKINENVQNVQL